MLQTGRFGTLSLPSPKGAFASLLLATGLALAGCQSIFARTQKSSLHLADAVTTWPENSFRWLDLRDHPYSEEFRNSFSYESSKVNLRSMRSGPTFAGLIEAKGLKPNFAYQVKLVGVHDDVGDPVSARTNETIGRCGRWWRIKPDPGNSNDADYDAHKGDPDYAFQGYLLFDFFVTDANGSAEHRFELDSSLHVLWKTHERPPALADANPRSFTIRAYDTYYKELILPQEVSIEVSIYGEWEPGRAPVGKLKLPPGEYCASLLLTEESFHSSGPGGMWASALITDPIRFVLVPLERTR